MNLAFLLQLAPFFDAPIVRLVPNTPCAVGRGCTLLYSPDEEAVSG